MKTFSFTRQTKLVSPSLRSTITNSSRLVRRCCLIGSLTPFLLGCTSLLTDHPLLGSQPTVQQAVDKVRTNLENDLGHPVPSLNVLIQTPNAKVFASSVPVGQPPISEMANFRFASITKNFTATALLNMHEDGWINYKAKITDLIPGTQTPYVPNTPDWNFPYKDQITIEQLLQHRAGVYDVDNDPVPGFNGLSYTDYTQTADPTHQFTTEEVVHQLILHQLAYFAPDTAYHYSNTGYSILGKIIERVYSTKSGSPKAYQDYMRDYIVGATATVPLLSIHFPSRANDTVLPSPRVEGLELLPGNVQKRYGDYNMSAQVGEGNGYGSLSDLHTYIRSLMKGQNVLTLEIVKRMQQDDLGDSFKVNLGYEKNGARIGNIAVIAYDPLTDVSVVSYLPLWDLTQGDKGKESFNKCILALYDAAYAGRAALGYPGKP